MRQWTRRLLLGLAATGVAAFLFAAVIAFRPVWVLDVHPRQLGSSLARATSAPGGGICRPRKPGGHYWCGTEIDPGSGVATSYSLVADEDGCWTAERTGAAHLRKNGHSPEAFSGCVDIFDWILPKDVDAGLY